MSYKHLLEAHWYTKKDNIYLLRLVLHAYDKPGVLLKILNIFDFLGVNLKDIHTEHIAKQGKTKIIIDLEFANPSKMYYILKELQSKKQLLKVVSREVV